MGKQKEVPVKDLIRELSFFSELPQTCPVCGNSLHFGYSENDGNDFYRLECDNEKEQHSSTLGTYKDETRGLFYKPLEAWYTRKLEPVTKPEQVKKKYIGAEGAVALERQLRAYKINGVATIPIIEKFVQASANRRIADVKSLETLTPEEAHKVLEDAKEAHQNAKQRVAKDAQKKAETKNTSGRIETGASFEESFGRN